MTYWLKVCSTQQKLYCFNKHQLVDSYPVSTAVNGLGEQENSGKTPCGWHSIVEKYGDKQDPNSIFIARKLTGEHYSHALARSHPGRDWITARILRLSGLEPGKNAGPGCDSYQRYIYIHGTPHIAELGQAASKGCIRMHNLDIIDLYQQIPLSSKVYIS